jgi:hypothetical protein
LDTQPIISFAIAFASELKDILLSIPKFARPQATAEQKKRQYGTQTLAQIVAVSRH